MKTRAVTEAPAFELIGRSGWDDGEERVVVTWDDLRRAKVGQKWEARNPSNVVRDVLEESAEVVYRTDRGVAVLHRTYRTADSPEGDEWETVELVWYEFAPGGEPIEGAVVFEGGGDEYVAE